MTNISPGFAFNFFRQQGWTPEQSAGIVGNLQWESGLNPMNNTGDSGLAYGIGQWHAPRQQLFASVFGHPIQQSTPLEQLQFTQYELTHGANGGLASQTTVAGATAAVQNGFERPASRTASINQRTSLANRVLSAAGSGGNGIISDGLTAGENALNSALPGVGSVASVVTDTLGITHSGNGIGDIITNVETWVMGGFLRIALFFIGGILFFIALRTWKPTANIINPVINTATKAARTAAVVAA